MRLIVFIIIILLHIHSIFFPKHCVLRWTICTSLFSGLILSSNSTLEVLLYFTQPNIKKISGKLWPSCASFIHPSTRDEIKAKWNYNNFAAILFGFGLAVTASTRYLIVEFFFQQMHANHFIESLWSVVDGIVDALELWWNDVICSDGTPWHRWKTCGAMLMNDLMSFHCKCVRIHAFIACRWSNANIRMIHPKI